MGNPRGCPAVSRWAVAALSQRQLDSQYFVDCRVRLCRPVLRKGSAFPQGRAAQPLTAGDRRPMLQWPSVVYHLLALWLT